MSWKWPHQKRSPAIARAFSNSSRTAAGPRVTDRIGDADAIRARIEQRLHAAQHFGLIDAALDRAAERRADAAFDQRLRTGRVARGTDAGDFRDHFIGRLAQVREAMCMARGQRHEQQVGLRLDGALGALEIGHEHRDDEVQAASSHRRRVRRCRRVAAGGARGRTSRLRFRAGRRHRRRRSIRSCVRSEECVWMLCRPSRKPTSRMTTFAGERGHVVVSVDLAGRQVPALCSL